MNNRKWTKQEDADLLVLGEEEFLAKYPHRTANGRRFRIAKLDQFDTVLNTPDPVAIANEDPDPEDYDAYFAKMEDANEIELRLGTTTDSVEFSFPGDHPIALAFFSDTHLGAGGVEYKRLTLDLETLRDTEGLYGVFNGDAIENTKTHSKSASALYSALIPKPRHQVEMAKRKLGLAFGKWLAFAQGNHDAFDYRSAGVDRMPDVAKALSAPYFSEKGGTLHIDVGSQHYVVVVKHQYTGQSRISKSNSARRLFEEWPWAWENADVVALAHLHEPDQHVTMRRGRDVHWLRSGTYKTHDAWSEANGYHPAYGVPVVILWPNERKIVSFHGSQFNEAVAFFKAIRGESSQEAA